METPASEVRFEVLHSPKGNVPRVLGGDIGLVHDWKEDWLGELIQAGERADYGHTAWTNLTHSFGVLDNTGAIVEANAPGVQEAHISKYKNSDLHILRPYVSFAQEALCIDRWRAQIGVKYAIPTFLGLAFNALSGGNVCFQVDRELICSGLVSYGMLAYLKDLPRPYQTMKPADIGMLSGLDLGEAPMPLSFFGRFLDKLRTTSRLLARAV